MIIADMLKRYPSADILVENRVASRLLRKDATLFDFSEDAMACSRDFMGWTNLAEDPCCCIESVREFTDLVIGTGIDTVILVGQGGSTQAPMTMTKYNKEDVNRIAFKTLDSDSPVRVRQILTEANLERTAVIVSSKSGTTLETRTLAKVLFNEFCNTMSCEEAVRHFVAITDSGSELETLAREEGWLGVFLGEPSVGGRFSALSAFGLLPAAFAGIDLDVFIEHALEGEAACAQDTLDNPAIRLASFLYDNYVQGRDKFSFLTPKRGRVLGLWIEQLVAESLGKEGQGILPNIEIDPLALLKDPGDRTAIIYDTKTDLWDERINFETSLACVDPAVPAIRLKIDTVNDLAEHFVMWEYAVAMCGYLMKVCPFDQPDVASSKAATHKILIEGMPEPDFCQPLVDGLSLGQVEVRVPQRYKGATNIREALGRLLGDIKPGDFFALNAFLPFTGEGRREALEQIRRQVAMRTGVASSLEIGPRYLHSTGQLQKGGANNGVFLILSAEEQSDIELPEGSLVSSLGELAKAQSVGDLVALAKRGRRCLHLHLPNNASATLRVLAALITEILYEKKAN